MIYNKLINNFYFIFVINQEILNFKIILCIMLQQLVMYKYFILQSIKKIYNNKKRRGFYEKL